MINLLLAAASAAAVWIVALLLGFPWYSGVFPALLVFPVVLFLLARRTASQVQAELAPVQGMMAELQQVTDPKLAQQRLAEVKQRLADVRDRYARWQVLLARQLDAQIGMLDYMLTRFDEALPKLERAWRDWTSAVAVACIHYRRGQLDLAWKAFEGAASVAPKEPTVYVVWGTLRERKGDRAAALEVFSRGLERLPEHGLLRQLKSTVANKRPIETRTFTETWYRFFPEEAAQQMMVRGRRGPPPVEGQPGVQVRQGPPQPRARGKLARRR